MKTLIFALTFWAVVLVETFYPLGDWVALWFGAFGTVLWYVLAIIGLWCTVGMVMRIEGLFEWLND